MRMLWAVLALAATPAAALEITGARYADPTAVYAHGALAGGEYARMDVDLSDGTRRSISFKKAIFEDTEPRLVDLNGDGSDEIVAVVSGYATGAWVQVFALDDKGRLAPAKSSAPIGQRHRWLSIAGIVDMDGDGVKDVVYVDRPHLAKELVVMPLKMGREGMLVPRLRASGLTNHHLGAPQIEGGVRVCADQDPVVVTANADWTQIMETRLEGGALVSTPVGPYHGPDSFTPFLACG